MGGFFQLFCANGFFHEKVGFLLFCRKMKHRLVELMNRNVFVLKQIIPVMHLFTMLFLRG